MKVKLENWNDQFLLDLESATCILAFCFYLFIYLKRWKWGCSYILANERVQSSLSPLLLSLVKSFSIATGCEWKILANISLHLSNSFWLILHVFLVPFVLSRSHTPSIRSIILICVVDVLRVGQQRGATYYINSWTVCFNLML